VTASTIQLDATHLRSASIDRRARDGGCYVNRTSACVRGTLWPGLSSATDTSSGCLLSLSRWWARSLVCC